MKILVACEYSGVVREAFRKKGHDVWSCDILPTEIPGQHIQDDVVQVINSLWGMTLGMVIGHPPCTRICNSGVLRLYKDGKKENGIDDTMWRDMEAGAAFFKVLLNSKCDRVAIENPVPHGYALDIIGQKYTQIIQPYNFGEDASKATCLWLKGLPKLVNTVYYPPRIVDGKKRWSNQTDSGQNKLAPSATRGKDRAKTYPGIAQAMSDQWNGKNLYL